MGALTLGIAQEAIIEAIDAETIYDVPNLMLKEGLDKVVLKKLGLIADRTPDLDSWNEFLRKFQNPKSFVEIGLVGKYVELQDAYKSIYESLAHAGIANDTRVEVSKIDSEQIENVRAERLL